MKQEINVLIVDDSEDDRENYLRLLKKASNPSKTHEAEDQSSAFKQIETTTFDCILLDYNLPGRDGIELLKDLKEKQPNAAIVMLTGQGSEDIAVQALKFGAQDYIPKNKIDGELLEKVLGRAIEHKELERKIHEQKEALANFARVLAHDLKSPIGSIITLLDQMNTYIENQNTEKVKRYIEMASKTAEQLNSLIDDLSEYNQAESETEFSKVDFNEVLKQVQINLEQPIQKMNVNFQIPSLPKATANKPQMVQIFQNLIGNGIKYCDADQPAIEVGYKEKEDSHLFYVKDNGIGMKEEDCESIFEPFKRLKTEKKIEGTGLGLATCKKIVKRHKGNIWCESKPGEGSTFTFALSKNLEAS